MECPTLVLRLCLLALACSPLSNADPINKVDKYVGYLKDVSSFLLSLPTQPQTKQEATKYETESRRGDERIVSDEKNVNRLGKVDRTRDDSRYHGAEDPKSKSTTKDYSSYREISPYPFLDPNDLGDSDKDDASKKKDYSIDKDMTPRCTFPFEKSLITKFKVVYVDNETTPGFQCTHTSWRIYSHHEKMKITPVLFAIRPPAPSPSADEKKDEGTTLTVYDGFDERSPVLFQSSNFKKSLTESYFSSKKRIFVKLTTERYPTGWEFILNIESVAKKDVPMDYTGYKNEEYAEDKPVNVASVGKSFLWNRKKSARVLPDEHKKDTSEDQIEPKRQLPLYSQTKQPEQPEQIGQSSPLEKHKEQHDPQDQHEEPLLQPKTSKQRDKEVDEEESSDDEKRFSNFGVIPGLRLEGDRKLVEGCDGKPMVLTTNYGVLYSPNFQLGTGYPGDSNCSWLITVDPGSVIKLSFISFSIEPPFPLTSLCFDSLKIYDGPKIERSTLKGTYCGKQVIEDFTSSSNQLFLNFKADFGVNHWRGFAIKYSSKALLVPKSVNPTCGHQKTQPNFYSRIVGGIQAKPHSWPWQISLQYEGNHICGACLLTSRWAVTAAHCLVDLDNIKNLFLRLGEHNLTMVEGSEETRQIDGWHIHPNYNTNTNDFDIALMHLDQEVSFNDYVMPACLPTSSTELNNLICVVAGWGSTKETSFNVVLNQLTVMFIESSTCNGKLWYDGRVTENMFCAGYKEGRRDSCQGDSGGPLVCSDGKRWSIYGVISWGFDCAQPRRPGVYTNVTLMQNWVAEQMNKSPDSLAIIK